MENRRSQGSAFRQAFGPGYNTAVIGERALEIVSGRSAPAAPRSTGRTDPGRDARRPAAYRLARLFNIFHRLLWWFRVGRTMTLVGLAARPAR